MSFTRKKITAIITLEKGGFNGTTDNQIKIEGLRISAHIDKAGGISLGTAKILIYGLLQSTMNELTQLAFHPLQIRNNKIDLLAGDDVTGMSLVFSGTIFAAYPDYNFAPDVPLNIDAMSGYYALVNPIAPTTVKGGADVASLIQMLAAQAGFTFENNGVQKSTVNPYQGGTAMEQIRDICADQEIDFYLDDEVLAITPKGQARSAMGDQIPLVSAASGLIGYPTFDKMGIQFESIYNPAIKFGAMVQIDTVIVPANGQYRMVSLAHNLECEKPGGAWFTSGWCTDNAVAIIP